MLLRIINFVALGIFFGTIPMFLVIQHNVNLYWDYFHSLFQDEDLHLYDFIVGRFRFHEMCHSHLII